MSDWNQPDEAESAPLIAVIGRGRGRGARSIFESRASSSRRQTESQPTVETTKQSKKIYSTIPDSARNSKQGVSGTPITLCANYFRFLLSKQFEFNLYHIEFEPSVDLVGLRKFLVAQISNDLGGYLFDGQSQIYVTKRLALDEQKFTVLSNDKKTYRLNIKKTGLKIEMDDVQSTQILNIILRRAMDALDLQLVGRNYFDPKNRVKLENFKVELWPGYITSIRQHEQEVLICCEVSHKVMRKETILDIMRDYMQKDSRNWQDSFRKDIVGSTVLTDYNNKTYKITDVDFNLSPRSTFQRKNEQVTYLDYYSRYNKNITDKNQPLLHSLVKSKDIRSGKLDEKLVYLIPELCRATGLTDSMRSNFTMMRAMAEHTQIGPRSRKERILQLVKSLEKSGKSGKLLQNFGVEIDQNLLTFQARQVNQEVVLFEGDGKFQNTSKVDWTNAFRSFRMYKSVPLKRWLLVYPCKCSEDVMKFLETLKEVATSIMYEMSSPKLVELSDDRTNSYVQELREYLQKDPKLVMVVVPSAAADRYAAIKKLCCIEKSIPSQVVLSKNLSPRKGGLSIATKIVIQMNCKLGGAPWMIKIPLDGIMTVGFDVTHDTNNRNMSYGAFVASMDLNKSVKFFSTVNSHATGAEISPIIGSNMISALTQFKETHNSLPSQIFYYRDGVGDGQIEQVHSGEVKQIEKTLVEFYNKYGDDTKLRFCFIIVNKRINTRFFHARSDDNVESGTIVDSTVTLPERYDFYLVSQSVRQGTVAPTSYNIIYDTSGFSPEKIQRFTYKMCHLYYNWSGCVRVPCVVQYAHKLALLAGEHLHQTPSSSFENQLYFL
ncbi:CLUMA_CG004289, isoform A [Clunio marinus]|uniref:CLUMA_CG004289, isoform A n=1 Tax=Clunio marinus TaxID=568069 RepID=A0A1J1HRI1_9DIPT|nr:CLUMA_CG004289, isoform A [Clunio marinus]